MSGRGTIFEEYLVMFEACWAKPFIYVNTVCYKFTGFWGLTDDKGLCYFAYVILCFDPHVEKL